MEKNFYDVVIVGAGVAGIETAIHLARMNYKVALLEKQNQPGGKLLEYARLFPAFEKPEDVLHELNRQLQHLSVDIFTEKTVQSIQRMDRTYVVESDSDTFEAPVVVLAYGFDFFDASLKEEYGYSVVVNVYTSVDFERMMKEPDEFKRRFGNTPRAFGFVHCVGSRDEKVKNNYCSKVCCVTAIKQATELKKLFPKSEVFCFYMDLRLHELMFESLYKEAQKEYGIHFIRGKISEVANTQEKKVVLKVEDTLLSMPLSMELDALFLMVGMEGKKPPFANGLHFNSFDFIDSGNRILDPVGDEGIFFAGTCKGPRSITETFHDASHVALLVHQYLEKVKPIIHAS